MALKAQIGENAGRIWRTLSKSGSQTFTQLAKQVDAPKEDLLLSLGWLAREDQIDISLEKRTYRIKLK